MRTRIFFVTLLIAVLLLYSCNLWNETPSQKCIVGTWQLTGNETFARALLPIGAFEQDAISFIDAGGVVGYSFDEQGKIFVDVIAWMSQLSVVVEGQSYPIDLNMIGDVSGSYSLDGDQLSVTSVDHSSLAFEAYLDGVAMMRSMKVNEFAPLFSDAYPVAQIECSETTLRLKLSEDSDLPNPIEFIRVNQGQEK
jgi:hypothetical protein